ncbi:MAG TPA: glycerophosphodiester phosphodiesterase family protein, partial [Methanoregulaceae archaeon]|nr:glycerophosphodiester phosphodiesterase family protein [Methanoregulaceae archaeon]
MQPENTIPAFLAALDSGVTTLEMDLAVTRDGQLIVSHEPWISTAICLDPGGKALKSSDERKLNIFQMTAAEVQQYDCGSKGNEKFPEQVRVKAMKPLLREVIIAVEDHIRNTSRYEVDYNIEIKSSKDGDGKYHPTPAEFSDLVFALLDDYLPLERVVIQSFDFRVLKYWHQTYPEVRLAALVENLKDIDENIRDLGFKPAIYSPHYSLLDKDEVKHLKQLGIRVIPWTVNDKKDMQELK